MSHIRLSRGFFASLVLVPLVTACAGHLETPPAVRPSLAAEADTSLPSPAALAVLDATLWMQTSAEYEALSRQTWEAAARLLPASVADTGWTAAIEQGSGAGSLPPAVIVDVDETVLDNSPYAARRILQDAPFSEQSWGAWVNEAKAKPVPGAVQFVRRARALGIEVFYVTNRLANLEAGTRRNLEAVGFPPGEAEDVLLLKNEREGWGSDKASRRSYIARNYRIVMLAGDNLADFVSGASDATIAEREELVEKYGDMWGRRWIVLANPTYGSWASAIQKGLESPGAGERLRRKLDVLDPAEE